MLTCVRNAVFGWQPPVPSDNWGICLRAPPNMAQLASTPQQEHAGGYECHKKQKVLAQETHLAVQPIETKTAEPSITINNNGQGNNKTAKNAGQNPARRLWDQMPLPALFTSTLWVELSQVLDEPMLTNEEFEKEINGQYD